MQLTSEQQAILNTDGNLVINAVAGSGKTTTLIEYARSRSSKSSLLYLAFNKTVKAEAQQKFSRAGLTNVRVETAHSLAFDRVVKFSRYQPTQGYKSYELKDLLDIQTGDIHTDFIIASHVNRFMAYFCNSEAAKVQDLDYCEVVGDAKARQFVEQYYTVIEKFTREGLSRMDKGAIPVTHDFYLKKFQLSNPVLDYDYILFDEGQDASAAMLSVFLQQKAIKVIVGDMHQQIYGWRFAVNSLQKVPFPVFSLTQSFRFDEEVALIANKILGWKQLLDWPPAVKLSGAGKSTPASSSKAVLGRTNLALLLHAIRLRQSGTIHKIYFEGNISSYTFADDGASLYDVLNLHTGNRSAIKDKLIAGMENLQQLESYIEKTEDKSLSLIVEVVKEYGTAIPRLIEELKAHHVSSKEEADMIFSTVHRCKGMEYDEVTLLSDFINEEKLKKFIDPAKLSHYEKNRLTEEINILYVAVTRARNKLKIPPELNPLQTIQLTVPDTHTIRLSRSTYETGEDPRSYKRIVQKRMALRGTGNHGKKWTEEEEETIERLFHSGIGLKEIAQEMGRGEAGVRIKLANMGLLEPGDEY